MNRIERAEASLLRYSLDKPVGGSGVAAVDVIVVELADSEGATGLGFTYVLGSSGGDVVLHAVRSQIAGFVLQQEVRPPQSMWRRIAATFNRTGLGPNLVGLAAIDMAAWDLESRRRNQSLSAALGGTPRAVPVYGSGGFNATQSPSEAIDTAAAHVARGLTAVKPRVANGSARDIHVMDAVRNFVPESVQIMLDANEKCDLPGARRLTAAAQERGILFVEEPLPAHAVEGYRALAAVSGAPIAAGEHLQGRHGFLPFISERLVALIQPDIAMAGGFTPLLEIATLAEAFDVAISPHFLPGLFVHLAAATPAVTWLEDFPLLEPLFEGWPELQSNGSMSPADAPGLGLTLRKAERKRYAVE